MTREEAEQKAHAVCQKIEEGMRAMGVVTTAHYDAGSALIADALLAAVAEEREACAKVADDYDGYLSHEGEAIASQIRARGQEPTEVTP